MSAPTSSIAIRTPRLRAPIIAIPRRNPQPFLRRLRCVQPVQRAAVASPRRRRVHRRTGRDRTVPRAASQGAPEIGTMAPPATPPLKTCVAILGEGGVQRVDSRLQRHRLVDDRRFAHVPLRGRCQLPVKRRRGRDAADRFLPAQRSSTRAKPRRYSNPSLAEGRRWVAPRWVSLTESPAGATSSTSASG